MSGGVDSSVAAYLMKERGFDCVGVTMKLFSNTDVGIDRDDVCCSLKDTDDARDVAYRLGIPHYVFNFSADFIEQVIRRFVEAYESGRTPNPCIDCNRYIKFDRLFSRARDLEYTFVVTGHYARIEDGGQGNRVGPGFSQREKTREPGRVFRNGRGLRGFYRTSHGQALPARELRRHGR
ncbi:MAG: hypothetical protein LBS00_12400 [Synergistaceae bacterium]|nr:hypothetical protein [Synergistaceae bacterium]